MRVAIDTNILLSAYLGSKDSRDILYEAIRGRIIPVATYPIFSEYVRKREAFVLRYGKTGQSLHRNFLNALTVFPPKYIPDVCRDRKDNMFLGAAEQKKAKYLITMDKDLLVLGSYKGTEIVTPRRFLELCYPKA